MTRRRFMQNPETERRLISGAIWFIAGCVILAILTSCSPYAAIPATVTATRSPSNTAKATVTDVTLSPTPRPSCTVTGYLNFRTSPSRSAVVIHVLKAGERVTVIERGAWLKVETSQRVKGWVYSKFCK